MVAAVTLAAHPTPTATADREPSLEEPATPTVTTADLPVLVGFLEMVAVTIPEAIGTAEVHLLVADVHSAAVEAVHLAEAAGAAAAVGQHAKTNCCC